MSLPPTPTLLLLLPLLVSPLLPYRSYTGEKMGNETTGAGIQSHLVRSWPHQLNKEVVTSFDVYPKQAGNFSQFWATNHSLLSWSVEWWPPGLQMGSLGFFLPYHNTHWGTTLESGWLGMIPDSTLSSYVTRASYLISDLSYFLLCKKLYFIGF